MSESLGVRWLGSVPYSEADLLQRAFHASDTQRLLLLEHPHTYTLGSRASSEHVLVDPASVGAELIVADRGGDVTYHGPGQLVGYPIMTLDRWMRSGVDVVAYVRQLEQVIIEVLEQIGIASGRNPGYSGVWVGSGHEQRKIAAIGVKVARGRTRHGFALNLNPDLGMFQHIVPCGISEWGVTSIQQELEAKGEQHLSMEQLAQLVGTTFQSVFHAAPSEVAGCSFADPKSLPTLEERVAALAPPSDAIAAQPVPVRLGGRLAAAGVDTEHPAGPRPSWMRVTARMDSEFLLTRARVREHGLVTVCEEAGCPNMYECWSAGTATFMINGERCTRACSFCLVDTRKPEPLDPEEPRKIAEAVQAMGLTHAVITCVARDDLADEGAGAFAATVATIRATSPGTSIELLISDCRGKPEALDTIFASRPEVLNHNLETVARLQRAMRPAAGYARSLAVLARSATAGLVTKSGLIVGMGETEAELLEAIEDLRAIGVSILTIGQYLQPSPSHAPVMSWVTPETFDRLKVFALSLGFAHVESGPLVRSSYHAREGAEVTNSGVLQLV